jgi:hypothetical protein
VVEGEGFEGWTPVAPPGGLSPTSSTSTVWGEAWPFKPDIVCEAGNMVRSPDGTQVDYCDAVQLLTTFHQPLVRLFQVTGDTSAATAAASRMAALVYAEYPRLWPETVRALLVHSAEWTDTMWGQFAPNRTRQELHTLLRCCGFGIPCLDVALWSAANAVTLIVEDDLQPFDEDAMNEMHLHSLPWPRDVLLELAETPVELRVTLSYFVEPNPGSRGWTRKFRYMSHGLRFDVKTPEESLEAFRQRMNHAARLEAEGQLPSEAVGRDWLLGPRLRSRGSLHTDRWTGTAAPDRRVRLRRRLSCHWVVARAPPPWSLKSTSPLLAHRVAPDPRRDDRSLHTNFGAGPGACPRAGPVAPRISATSRWRHALLTQF